MEFSLGLIAFHNISKSNDFFIAYTALILGGALGFVMLKKYSYTNFFEKASNSDWASFSLLWIAISACIVKLTANPIERVCIGLTFSMALIYLIKNTRVLFKYFSKNNFFYLIILGAINLKLWTNTYGIASFFTVNITIALVTFYMGTRAGLLATACFVLKDVANSNEVIEDMFHKAEYFVTYFKFRESISTFPNIGYIEQWLPNSLLIAINAFGFGQISISLSESRFILSFLFSMAIFSLIFKKQSLFATLCLLFIPAERISLLAVIVYALLLIDCFEKQNKWGFIALAAPVPTLFLTLSPSYSLILIFAFVWTYPFQNKQNFLFIILGIWIFQIYYLFNYFIEYFKIYNSLSASNLIAHGKSFFKFESSMFVDLSYGDIKIYTARLVFVFLVGATIGQIYRLKSSHAIGAFKFSLVLFASIIIAYLYIQYAFTRIDPLGYTRIIPTGLAIVIIICYATDFFSKSNFLLLFVCAYLTSSNQISIDAKYSPENHHLRLSSPYITFSEYNLALSESISKFAKNSPIILYGNEPALIITIPNAILPPFTTPWVTVGKYPQEINIDFLKKNPYAIYIGNDFSTFDEIDIRARSPILFKYLAYHYELTRSNGLLYAVPSKKNNAIDSELFSGFDIGKTSSYLRKHHNQDKMNYVEVVCADNKLIQKFKVKSKNNFFYADLHCGSNKIPSVYFDGDFIALEKI